ncbi:RHS repeat-associated core domain-containing protein [Pedobacter sp.]|uniref:RHS repeat-associated core domain-containing protein n=1 Tax=Pedobacter sp. TaxID=1411316 RepID=UPI00396C2E8E
MKRFFSIILIGFISLLPNYVKSQAKYKNLNNDTIGPKVSPILKENDLKTEIIKNTIELQFPKNIDGLVAKGMDSIGIKSKQVSAVSSGSSTVLGKTNGVLDVSQTGSATYSIPFTLPPGIGNMVPQIGLTYNSQAGNGTTGLGWNISGLSSITRIASSYFHDGKITGTNFDQNDRFALDGQRLVLKNGTYGADGAEYQTENFSNIKIVSRGVSPSGANYGPAYFEVFYPDGSKAVYGGNANAMTNTSYALTYMENSLGARINYVYAVSDNTIIVTEINYGSMGSTPGLNKIQFEYEEINRAEMNYVGGERLYRKSLLDKVKIIANGSPFRTYSLIYENVPVLNYKRIVQLRELDGSNPTFLEPINFSYGTTSNYVSVTTINNLLGPNNYIGSHFETVIADYSGNGMMDILVYRKFEKNRFWLYTDPQLNTQQIKIGNEVNIGDFINIFSGNILNPEHKLLSRQGVIIVKSNNGTSYKFSTYANAPYAPIILQQERIWENVPLTPSFNSECTGYPMGGDKKPMTFLSGDFNGDGITDVLAISESILVTGEYPQDPTDPQYNPGNCDQAYNGFGSSIHLISLDNRLSTNFVTDLGMLIRDYTEHPYINSKSHLYTGDFNGDGKTDLMQIFDGELYVYGLNSSNSAMELLWKTTDTRIKFYEQILIGDYNGDGKTDVMFSTGFNNLFAMFLSTGKAFQKQEENYPFSRKTSTWDGTTLKEYNLIPVDINGDGKTDIIETNSSTQNNVGGTAQATVYHNTGTAPSYKQHFELGGSTGNLSIGDHYPMPVFLNIDKINPRLEFGLLSRDAMRIFNFQKDFKSEAQIKQISQDNVTYKIDYAPLTTEEIPGIIPYDSSIEQVYPFVDIENIPGLNVVTKVTRTYKSSSIQQVFGYGLGVSHMEGFGFMGFGKTIRSNWHVDAADPNLMFDIVLSNPQLRGAPVKTFTSKGFYLNPSVVNSAVPLPDITLSNEVNNAQVSEASNSITLLPGFEANGANGTYVARIMDPATGINDGATIYNYITRTDYTYQTTLLPNKVFINTPISVSTKDLLNGTHTLQLNEYDNYYNITKTTTNLSGAGIKTEEITYDNNPAGYYIGRPLTRKTTNSISGDTHTTEEQYTYTGSLPTQIKRKGNGTVWLTENLTYDTFGNVTQKTIVTPNNGQRSTSSVYDPTGRFVSSVTDAEGLTTSYTYDLGTGNILTQTNPYGQITSFTYDIWGRPKEKTDYAGKKSYTNYQAGPNGYIITETDDEGHEKVTYYNHLGQSTEVTEKTLTGSLVGTATQYDVYGRAYRQSQPAAPGSYNQWNETAFDEYGRIKKTTAYTGKVTNYSYNGLSTTVNDGTKSITTTKNALGQTISLQDPGGTINYAYYAHGGLKNANYDGAIQSLEYDGWGRKTKLTDPSAGVYTYAYNDFGEITQETTPKGTTSYTYDNATGKLTAKTLTGDATNLGYAYSYNTTTKLLEGLTFTNTDGNNANYTYTYDNNKRLASTVEDNVHATFTKTYTYDSFDRIATETYQAKDKASNTTANRTIAYTYQNGEVLQVTDQTTGQILSKTQTLKPNGLLATELQGANLKTTYTYDAFNLPQSAITERTGTNPATLMTLGYSFDAQRGNLNSRSNSALSWSESFSYDNSDRLIGFNDNNGSNTQAYDARGRITQNSQLGNYVYSGTGYQQTELNNPTPTAYNWYQSRSLQQISFNAFKQPVNINEQGAEQIDFQYNAALQRSHMYYGSTDADKMLRPMRRHYSEDGGMEITRNLTTGETSFVFYLGGDAYSAPAIYKEVHNNSGTVQDLYYLHRDHLGSIVLITDVNGNAVEKRQFDAWGNIVALTDGNGNPLTAFVVLDRGYTGHEHLLGVGLIHMNGRLYDPKLHRFLSPDNFVQDASNTQNFNRYGYVMNNPLIANDPNGEFIWLVPALIFVAKAAITGAAIAAVSYTASVAFSKGGFDNWNWGQFGKSIGFGAVSGIATAGIGSAFGEIGKFGHEVLRGLAHGIAQGGISELSGGNFLQGFAAGGLGSLAGSGWQAWGGKVAESGLGNIAFSALSGGVGAELTGGDFWQGAATGATVTTLNHLAHMIMQEREYEYNGKKYTNKAELYRDILLDQAAEQFGIKDILALGAAIDGMGLIDKPFQTPGASKGTSLLSKELSKAFPQKMPVRLPTISNRFTLKFTNVLGRFMGRSIPIVGWGILAYDVSKTFYNTQKIYNRLIR